MPIHLMSYRPGRSAFTLIELLVVVAIIAVLIGILIPALSAARKQGKATKCLAHMRVLGQGMAMYLNENRDIMLPGRLPKVDNCNWYGLIKGRRKYRPTFLTMMHAQIGVPSFADPMSCKNGTDRFGQAGDRQDYSSPIFVCPSVPEWTDERNGSYGYNYQFLGNSRLSDPSDIRSFKNWPVRITEIRYPGRTVSVADSMGTAASFPPTQRADYENNARDADRLGNEGFNLDPPLVDTGKGEMANFPLQASNADPRHSGGRANVLWVDGHAAASTAEKLGYKFKPDGSFAFDGENSMWTGDGSDKAWTPDFRRR